MRLIRSALRPIACATALMIGTCLPAGAGDWNGTTGAEPTQTGGQTHISVPGSSAPAIPLGAIGTPAAHAYAPPPMTCTGYTITGSFSEGGTGFGQGPEITDYAALEPGTPIYVECRDPDTGALLDSDIVNWDPTGGSPRLPASAADVGQEALRELVLPAPVPTLWPPSEHQLVGLASWFHVDSFAEAAETVELQGVSATVRAVPVRVVWHLGETDLTCTSAGTVWSEAHPDATTDCGYTFERYTGSTHEAAVDLVYRLDWWSNQGDAGDLGEVTRSSTFPLRVWEAQALIE